MKKRLLPLLRGTMHWLGFHLYEYPKADNTSTVVVLFDKGTRTLVVKRKKNPFKGKKAFPGGFLNVGKETQRQCGWRELTEETSLVFDEERFVPVDERSSPNRDPRGHVIDHGFLVVVPEADTEAVLKMIFANDDAETAEVVTVASLLAGGMAFDHVQLLHAALLKASFTA